MNNLLLKIETMYQVEGVKEIAKFMIYSPIFLRRVLFETAEA